MLPFYSSYSYFEVAGLGYGIGQCANNSTGCLFEWYYTANNYFFFLDCPVDIFHAPCPGQVPILTVADRTITSTCGGSYSGYFASFAENQNISADVRRALPTCGVFPDNTGDFLRLVNTMTGGVMSKHGRFVKSTVEVKWDRFARHLKAEHIGTYACQTSTNIADKKYQLHIVCKYLYCDCYLQ